MIDQFYTPSEHVGLLKTPSGRTFALARVNGTSSGTGVEGIVRILGEGVLCGLPHPDPISDQKMLFSHQFSDLGYLPFTWEMRKFWMGNQMVFTHEITNNPTNAPMIFKGTLTLASEVHSYNTRFVSTRNSHRPRIRNNYGVYLIFRDYMVMLKNFYPQSRFLTPIPSH